MGESILNGKSILAVDDEFDVLDVLEEEILGLAQNASLTERPLLKKPSRNWPLVLMTW